MTGTELSLGGLAVVSLVGSFSYAALAVLSVLRRMPLARAPYVAALLGMALWLGALGLTGIGSVSGWIAEAVRNLAWLWFMASIAGRRTGDEGISQIGWIYIGLFFVETVIAALLLLPTLLGGNANMDHALDTLQMLFCAGGLVLLHNLFEAADADERRGLTLPLAAIAGLWTYDLNLYVISYLSDRPATLLLELRPFAAGVVALVFAIALVRPAGHKVRLSRPVAFRSVALAAVAAWLVALSLFTMAVNSSLGTFGAFAQLVVLTGTSAGALALWRSNRLRARLRVWTTKHFFEHRYDYRAEWLRFTATLSRSQASGLTLESRVIKAVADIVESTGGLLLTPDSGGRLSLAAVWPHSLAGIGMDDDLGPMARWMASEGRIVQFDELRAGTSPEEEMQVVPSSLLLNPDLWIAVPLLHLDRTEGIMLLSRPPLDRALDWEDFDLLKVAGTQAASHIAEARGAEALAESNRFEEFHRRFAFMMHDVKNLTSQMALLARNVERHGDNPDFREDMIVTLRLSADRLGQMMQRLSQQEKVRIEGLGPVDAAAAAMRVAVGKRGLHRVQLLGEAKAKALADQHTLEQLLIHLVQNAIDATIGDAPVTIQLGEDDKHVLIAVEDRGVGMSPEFIRTQLFRPFSSTKDGGFGIGAFQARQLAVAMGGTLNVESREGEGTIFTLTLPRADVTHVAANTSEAA
ncbi:PEP-CTERM system histidine kinase PrsK [Sphingomonas lacunae]|uniref:histidine kinase n=1 Tax=Sphingomonas lacunae TaxID=2698828 RepID=A0A6M4AQW8_9SPHN|nr:XrtA/PEP-CTERM system histidine kinase PrsK [Sphingomonas lacunae]QJQ31096.1 PEP-CTERM system histidine kinase PrsK [Sphingomonas lacunae]